MIRQEIKPLKLYLISLLGGFILMLVLLILVCSLLSFDIKSAVSLYFFGGLGYLIKAMIFFAPYFLLYKQDLRVNPKQRKLVIWTPLILFSIWYSTILLFEIEILIPDVSYGYIMRFPHFVLQIITTLIICIGVAVKINRLFAQSIDISKE